ncbi:hypothetical protein JIN85_16135 [Luteolibacter pohnpeiensis]|uniref:Uncharacterized protein n=1 Tax=Luteolibacter pohnpeiensis TaxID=454153 RepID=A0A934S9X0_9BACT|nr:hypothetical protein [Luteolibacter pohnpeiensis]MBK1883949.1 hypothetical protein [Luteolibacter pohnpeiensis]
MKKLILTAMLVLSSSTFSVAEDELILNLSDGVTWKGVFDAGFRPKHLSDGIYMCRQYGVNLTITLGSEDSLNLGKGDVDFSVKQDGLVLVSFYGRENRSLEEARKKSEAFAKMFGEDLTRRAELDTFETKHEVDYGGRKLDPPEIEEHVDLDTATNAAKVGDFSIIYGFGDSYRDDLPLVERLSVALNSQEAKRAKRLTEKIRPPEGYEHVSLEPTQDAAEPSSENTTPNIERETGYVEVSRPERQHNVVKDDTVTRGKNHLLWVIGGVLLLGVVVILVRVLRRGQASEG